MRAVALCVLVLVASASAAWNTLTVPGSGLSGVKVSQTGLIPGRTSISVSELQAGQLDVRTGSENAVIAAPYISGADFTAPYAGCYYFYTADLTPVSTTPLCTSWAEWASSTSRTPAAVTLTLVGGRISSNAGTASPTTPYTFTLSFKVDAGYAGTAFEFLNQNVVNPTDSDTRCGVAYNNLIAAVNDQIPSPHANGNSNFVINKPGTDASTNGAWSFADLFTGVDATNANGVVNYTVSNYNTVLANCGWKRDETSADYVIYRAQIRITTVQQGRSIRGVLYKSIKESVVEIGIRFSTQVTAFSSTLNVNNILINYAQLVKQVFDPLQRKAYLLLFTSSQGPYQLEPSTVAVGGGATASAECISATGQGCKSTGWTASPVTAFHFLGQGNTDVADLKLASDISALAAGSITNGRAQCWSQTNNVPNYAAESPQSFSQCNQYWFMQLGAPEVCEGFEGTQTLDGSWRVNFKISCHDSYTGSCVIQAPTQNTITVDFGTQSDNYCPRIVDTITASAVLKVYDDVERTKEQSQFVFGTTSYFVATVQSTIQTAALFTEEIAITKGGAVNNQNFAGATALGTAWVSASTTVARQLVFSSTFNTAVSGNAAAYFASVESTTCTGGSGFNKLVSDQPEVQTGTQITTTGYFTRRCYFAGPTGTGTGETALPVRDFAITQFNATTGNSGLLTSANYFQWYWDSAVSKAQGDFAEITEVKWIGRLRYTDQAAAPKLSTIIRANHLDAVGTTSASVTSTMSAPQAAAPSEAAISTTTIAVAAAAVAAVAVMAIAAFVVLRSRNVKAEAETNLESVTLGSVHSASSAQL